MLWFSSRVAKPELVVSTGSFYPTSTSAALARVARLGFKQAEVTIQDLELDYNFHKLVKSHYFEDLRDLARKLGLRVTSLHAPSLSSVQTFSYRARRDILVKCLDAGALLGADEVVVHPYHVFRSYEEACSFFSKESSSIDESTLPGLPMTLQHAEELGLTIAMENIAHWYDQAFLNDPNNMVRLVSSLEDRIGVDLDIFHSELGRTTFEFLEKLRDHIVSIHLCDHTETGERTLPGRGKTKWPVLAERIRGLPRLKHSVLEMAGSFSDDELIQSASYLREVFDLEL